jgi:hypothetical protein
VLNYGAVQLAWTPEAGATLGCTGSIGIQQQRKIQPTEQQRIQDFLPGPWKFLSNNPRVHTWNCKNISKKRSGPRSDGRPGSTRSQIPEARCRVSGNVWLRITCCKLTCCDCDPDRIFWYMRIGPIANLDLQEHAWRGPVDGRWASATSSIEPGASSTQTALADLRITSKMQ